MALHGVEGNKRVEKNLSLENISIDKKIAQRAIEVVNSGEKLTPELIKEVIKGN